MSLLIQIQISKVKGGKVNKVKGMSLGGKKKNIKETKEDEEKDN